MVLKQQAAHRTAKLALASLVLLVSLHCNVYDSSLLGTLESSAGAGARVGHSGASGTTGGADAAGGRAGKPEPAGGAGAGFGGLIGMAGEVDTGGADANGGSSGNEDGVAGIAGAVAGSGGAVAGSGGAIGGSGGSAGAAVQTATGCAKLSVPLDATTDKAHFVISLTSAADLSAATISMRVLVQAGQGGTIFNYVQDSGAYRFLGVPAAQRTSLSSSNGWTTINWNVGAEPDAAGTGIVKTSIKSIGIEINAQPSSTWSNPTIVYVDSISVTTPTLSFTFDASASVSMTSASGQALWLNSGSSDTTASDVAISWQATCP